MERVVGSINGPYEEKKLADNSEDKLSFQD